MTLLFLFRATHQIFIFKDFSCLNCFYFLKNIEKLGNKNNFKITK